MSHDVLCGAGHFLWDWYKNRDALDRQQFPCRHWQSVQLRHGILA